MLAKRLAFVPFLAKADERTAGAFQIGLAHVAPPGDPFLIEGSVAKIGGSQR